MDLASDKSGTGTVDRILSPSAPKVQRRVIGSIFSDDNSSGNDEQIRSGQQVSSTSAVVASLGPKSDLGAFSPLGRAFVDREQQDKSKAGDGFKLGTRLQGNFSEQPRFDGDFAKHDRGDVPSSARRGSTKRRKSSRASVGLDLKELVQKTTDLQMSLVQEAIHEGMYYTGELVKQKLAQFYETQLGMQEAPSGHPVQKGDSRGVIEEGRHVGLEQPRPDSSKDVLLQTSNRYDAPVNEPAKSKRGARASILNPLKNKTSAIFASDHTTALNETNFMSQFGIPDWNSPTMTDRWLYLLENMAASNANAYFYLLFVITVILVLTLAGFWALVKGSGEAGFHERIWGVFLIAAIGEIGDGPEQAFDTFMYFVSIFMGLIVFAVFIGMITEAFDDMIHHFETGDTKVTESNHTLIIGWNESTLRTICQLAYLRRGWKMQNEVWHRRWCPWRRVKAATPCAKGTIVVICDTKTKQQMQEEIEEAFCEKGISRKRTRVGWDVVIRIGDPTSSQDLYRVGAHRASAILVSDGVECVADCSQADQGVQNGNTLRTLLALRQLLFTHSEQVNWDELRCVVQLSGPCKAIEAAKFAAPDGRECVLVLDLSLFVNALMFNSISQHGMTQLILDIVNFDGAAIRLRCVKDFEDGGEHLVGKTFGEISRAWEDAIPIGIVTKDFDGGLDEHSISFDNGFAPDSNRIICVEDRLMFVSRTTLPKVVTKPLAKAEITSKPRASDLKRSLVGAHVLCCGWRPEWNNPLRFAFRIKETAEACAIGSSMHFLCTIESATFEQFMEAVKAGSSDITGTNGVWMCGDRLTIRHTFGDAAEYELLEKVVSQYTFNKAVVMSPMAAKQLSPSARDTRMLSIMLFLRHIQMRYAQPPMHVLGENALDRTGPMALVPRNDDSPMIPDLVNAQAIYARVLTNALAFPRTCIAVAQLFSSQNGSPVLGFRQASACVPLDIELTFAEVIEFVKMQHKDDVCIGYRKGDGSQSTLAPLLRNTHTYEPLDEIVVISRSLGTACSDSAKHD